MRAKLLGIKDDDLGFEATGTGISKQRAKANAAKARSGLPHLASLILHLPHFALSFDVIRMQLLHVGSLACDSHATLPRYSPLERS